MNERHHLDSAIDAVAARMVHVEDDAALALRIAGALPERARFTWLFPQLAIVTTIVVAAIVWTMPPSSSPVVLLPSSPVEVVAALPVPAVAREPGAVVVTRRVERVEAVEPLERVDHERSLPSLAAMDALMVSDLTPEALPASPALTLAPIGVIELPLTAESTSQKEE